MLFNDRKNINPDSAKNTLDEQHMPIVVLKSLRTGWQIEFRDEHGSHIKFRDLPSTWQINLSSLFPEYRDYAPLPTRSDGSTALRDPKDNFTSRIARIDGKNTVVSLKGPNKKSQYTEEEKGDLGPKLPYTYVNIEKQVTPEVFRIIGSNGEMPQEITGVMFELEDPENTPNVLIGQIFTQDAWTTERKYYYGNDEAKLMEFANEYMANNFAELEEKNKNARHYNEILARTKWGDNASIAIFQDNLLSRLIAQLHAEDIKTIIDKPVPIKFYIPRVKWSFLEIIQSNPIYNYNEQEQHEDLLKGLNTSDPKAKTISYMTMFLKNPKDCTIDVLDNKLSSQSAKQAFISLLAKDELGILAEKKFLEQCFGINFTDLEPKAIGHFFEKLHSNIRHKNYFSNEDIPSIKEYLNEAITNTALELYLSDNHDDLNKSSLLNFGIGVFEQNPSIFSKIEAETETEVNRLRNIYIKETKQQRNSILSIKKQFENFNQKLQKIKDIRSQLNKRKEPLPQKSIPDRLDEVESTLGKTQSITRDSAPVSASEPPKTEGKMQSDISWDDLPPPGELTRGVQKLDKKQRRDKRQSVVRKQLKKRRKKPLPPKSISGRLNEVESTLGKTQSIKRDSAAVNTSSEPPKTEGLGINDVSPQLGQAVREYQKNCVNGR